MCAWCTRHLGKGACRAPVASLRPTISVLDQDQERVRSLFGNSSTRRRAWLRRANAKGRLRLSPWNPIDRDLETSLSTRTGPWTNVSALDDDQPCALDLHERRRQLAESGSQNRKRRCKRAAALTPEEAAIVDAMADRAGVSVSSLIRCAVLNYPLARAVRRPTINHEVAARLLGELGSVAEAFRIAAEAQADPGQYEALLDAAARDLAEMRLLWFQAMGREP